MKKSGRSHWLILGLAVAVGACARTHPNTAVNTSAGEVGLMDGTGGMWMDGVGSIWIDTTGMLRRGGRMGSPLGLSAGEVAMMNDRNMLAHIRADDSLEVVLGRLGMSSATNSAVRDFAQQMISDHMTHEQQETKLGAQTGIAAVTWRPDSTDQIVLTRVMTHLSRTPAGPNFDRQFMAAEVMMHEHTLHDLTLFQQATTGHPLDFVDHSMTTVKRHLKDAKMVLKSL
jgi:predicted outer membrane protein